MSTKGDNRKTFYACLAYPTEDYYKKVMAEIGEDPTKYYDGYKGWGQFDEKSFSVLEQSFVPTLISPLHFKDIDSDGNYKKPHFHMLHMYGTKKDFTNQVLPFIQSFDGVPLPENMQINSQKGYARYLCHLDVKPSELAVKPRYNSKYVVELAGADYDSTVHMVSDDKTQIRDIFRFIRKYNVLSFAHLLDILEFYNLDWYNLIIQSRSYITQQYIKSLAWELGQDKEHYERLLQCDDNGKLYIIDDNGKHYLEDDAE